MFLRAAVERCCARNTRRIIIISTEKQRRSAVTQCVTSDLKLTIVSHSSRIKNNFKGENFMGQGFDFIPRKKKKDGMPQLFFPSKFGKNSSQDVRIRERIDLLLSTECQRQPAEIRYDMVKLDHDFFNFGCFFFVFVFSCCIFYETFWP